MIHLHCWRARFKEESSEHILMEIVEGHFGASTYFLENELICDGEREGMLRTMCSCNENSKNEKLRIDGFSLRISLNKQLETSSLSTRVLVCYWFPL